jgi:hypothetical protein
MSLFEKVNWLAVQHGHPRTFKSMTSQLIDHDLLRRSVFEYDRAATTAKFYPDISRHLCSHWTTYGATWQRVKEDVIFR